MDFLTHKSYPYTPTPSYINCEHYLLRKLWVFLKLLWRPSWILKKSNIMHNIGFSELQNITFDTHIVLLCQLLRKLCVLLKLTWRPSWIFKKLHNAYLGFLWHSNHTSRHNIGLLCQLLRKLWEFCSHYGVHFEFANMAAPLKICSGALKKWIQYAIGYICAKLQTFAKFWTIASPYPPNSPN